MLQMLTLHVNDNWVNDSYVNDNYVNDNWALVLSAIQSGLRTNGFV